MKRYPKNHHIFTDLDPFEDVQVLLSYLTATDYLLDLLTSTHSIALTDAKARAKLIVPHIHAALGFFQQAQTGPPELSFLPNYYGILNLIKVYVLFGPYHNNLTSERWHGAVYRGFHKDSQNLLTERIFLKQKGALPLFYKTIVGKPWSERDVCMSDIYPYISSVSAEYFLATRKRPSLVELHLDFEHPKSATEIIPSVRITSDTDASVRQLKVLKGFKRAPSDKKFLGTAVPIKYNASTAANPLVREQFRDYLIYHSKGRNILTPKCSKMLLLPEELPIALLFFHMSSVVRYKPDFLEKVRDSRYWAILAASRRHCVYQFLVLAWSYFHKENLILSQYPI